MKIKTFHLILILAMMSSLATAQPFYQTTTTYNVGDNITYKCDNVDEMVTLYNSQNRYTYIEQKNADGSTIDPDIFLGKKRVLKMTEATDPDIQGRVNRVINSYLSAQQKEQLKEWSFKIRLIINPSDTKVIEVIFKFPAVSGFKNINPAFFKAIEQSFLNPDTIIGLTVKEEGRRLNYIALAWVHYIE